MARCSPRSRRQGVRSAMTPVCSHAVPSLSRSSPLIDRIRDPRNPAKLEDGQQEAKQGKRDAGHNERKVIHRVVLSERVAGNTSCPQASKPVFDRRTTRLLPAARLVMGCLCGRLLNCRFHSHRPLPEVSERRIPKERVTVRLAVWR